MYLFVTSIIYGKKGIFILARMDSLRLLVKHLKDSNIENYKIIEILMKRVDNEFKDTEVEKILLTGNYNTNKDFEQIAKNNGFVVHYGDDLNILKRIYECAKYLNINKIILIDGDNILLLSEVIRFIIDNLEDQFIKTKNLLFGMNCTGFTLKNIDDVYEIYMKKKTIRYRLA